MTSLPQYRVRGSGDTTLFLLHVLTAMAAISPIWPKAWSPTATA